MTNPAVTAKGPDAAPDGVRRESSPMRLYDPEDVPVVAEALARGDVAAPWARVRDRWGDVAPVDLGSGVRAWLVTGYQTIVMLARDSTAVTTDPGDWNGTEAAHRLLPAHLQRLFAPQALATVETTTGAAHARLRVPLEEALQAVDAAEVGRATRVVCEALIEGLRRPGVVDLMHEYVTPVAHLAFGAALGFDATTSRQVFELADEFAAGNGDSAGLDELSFLLAAQAMGRGVGGAPTPAALLAQHPAYEGTEEAMLGMLTVAIGASHGIQAWLGQALLLALTDEPFSRRLASGRLGTDEALDGVLWNAPPVLALAPRFAVTEGHLFGDDLYVERGDAVLLGVGAVASDPRIRGEGEWDSLGNDSHLAFGVGPHKCPAPRQARLIVRTAVETLMHAEPALATDAAEIRWAPDLRFRRPEALPATLRTHDGDDLMS